MAHVKNMRQVGNICTNSRKPYPIAICTPDLFEGEPFTVIEAYNSTTGRHGSGKTRFIYSLLFSKKTSTAITPTDTQVIPWTQCPQIQTCAGVVTSVQPLCVKHLSSWDQQEPVILRDKIFTVGEQITYYRWTDAKGAVIPFYYG